MGTKLLLTTIIVLGAKTQVQETPQKLLESRNEKRNPGYEKNMSQRSSRH